ncbi:MAG: hypothetical protein O6941_10150 [Planctomycetota bacterium]|nr:hypothetical protein [Planctomycetota bacterium]MCZ6612985.1 hypothetical protein [Planctomycetota bacterium]MCZ6734913.1 hypothetical protein [Planctomycetota bacterium]MCZ6851818.1 hypothetical protein [Planctomycetota bacterium]
MIDENVEALIPIVNCHGIIEKGRAAEPAPPCPPAAESCGRRVAVVHRR